MLLLLRTPFFLLFLYLLYVLSAAEKPPPRPLLSETFTSEVNTLFVNIPGQFTVTGGGHIGRDYSKLMQVIDLALRKFEYPNMYYQLKRYDLRKTFTVTETIRQEKYCQTDALLGPFGEVWSWLYSAMYVGTVTDDGYKFEVWNYTVNGNETNSLWVSPTQRHKPVRYVLEKKNQHVTVVNFKSFKPIAPTDPHEYDVPNICRQTPLPTAKHIMNFSRDFDDTED